MIFAASFFGLPLNTTFCGSFRVRPTIRPKYGFFCYVPFSGLIFWVTFCSKLQHSYIIYGAICLILSGHRGGLQQYMWFCKLQSVLHVQHENKVLNPGLRVQRIATDLEIRLYGLKNHRVGTKNPEFHGIIMSH